MKRPPLLALFSGVLVLVLCAVPVRSQDDAIRSLKLGINHISAPNDPIADQRYQNALMLGVGWNRWPLYWDSIERTPGSYDWRGYDQLVADDVRYGLHTDVILLGTPPQYDRGGRIPSLYESIFSDGTDIPGSGKQPNPANPYASFVYAAVMRYKPGGTLAVQLGWQPDQGMRYWEAWNEPDLQMFWRGSIQDYARLLKVTYLTVHYADPLAQVVFGGLAYQNPDWIDYLAQTLAVFSYDPLSESYNWYFDIAAAHSYTNIDLSRQVISRIRQVLAAYKLNRPVWLNESGVPVWDDYPGQTWTAHNPAGHEYQRTLAEQAIYMVESTSLAWAAGADVVFIFQLYDDCGNQPSGTDFPPNSGQAGDAYGLFRNDRSASCFRQSAQPNTPRPAASALYRMAQLFGTRRFNGAALVDLGSKGRVVAFDLSPLQGVANFGPVTAGGSSVSERAYVLWNDSRNRLQVEVPASGSSAQLYSLSGDDYQLAPQNGLYTIGLPAVDSNEFPMLTANEVLRVSGVPYILIEQVQPGWTPVDPQRVRLEGSNAPSISIASIPTVTSAVVIPTPAMPTPTPEMPVDPAFDVTPPVSQVEALPVVSPPTFTVAWGGQDDSGIAGYIVWVRVNGGDWQKWLETADMRADYTGATGSLYEFAVWAVDLAGNWSQNIELSPQAVTRVQ